jgi:hypothetical protein
MAYHVKVGKLKSLLYPFVTQGYEHLTIENIQGNIEKGDIFPANHTHHEDKSLALASRLAINPREHKIVLDFSHIEQGLAPTLSEGHEYLASVFWRELHSQHALNHVWIEVGNVSDERILATVLGLNPADEKNHYWSNANIKKLEKVGDILWDEMDHYIDNPWDDDNYVIDKMKSWSIFSNDIASVPAYWFDNPKFIDRMLKEVPEMIKILPMESLKNEIIINAIGNHVQAYAFFWQQFHGTLSYSDSALATRYEKMLKNPDLTLGLIKNHGFSALSYLKPEVLSNDEIIKAIVNNYQLDINGTSGLQKPVLKTNQLSQQKETLHKILAKSGFLEKEENVDFFLKAMAKNLDFFDMRKDQPDEKYTYLIQACCTNENTIVRNWEYLSQIPALFWHIESDVLKNEQVLCQLIKIESNFYSGLSLELRQNLNVIKTLVENPKTNMFVFYSVPSETIFPLEDKELIKKIIKAHPDVLMRENCPWKDNLELVRAASFKALDYELSPEIKESLLNDKSLVMAAVNYSYKYYHQLSAEVKEEWQISSKYLEKIVEYINHKSSGALHHSEDYDQLFAQIPNKLWLNMNFCQQALKHGGGASANWIKKTISEEMWQDTEFVLQALKAIDENKASIHYLPSIPQKVQQFFSGMNIQKGQYHDSLYNHLQRIKIMKGINQTYDNDDNNEEADTSSSMKVKI